MSDPGGTDDEWHGRDPLEDIIPADQIQLLNAEDIRGEDLKLVGFVKNFADKMAIIESSLSKVLSPGTPVFLESYSRFGHILDVFGPIERPLYIVSPDAVRVDCIGQPLYLCELAMGVETLEDHESDDSSSVADSEPSSTESLYYNDAEEGEI